MAGITPLTTEFMKRYPADAARVLEELAPADVAALLDSVSAELNAPVLAHALPDHAAHILQAMQPQTAVRVFAEIAPATAARIFRFLSPEHQKALSALMPRSLQRRIRHFTEFATISAGDLMDTDLTMLPVEITAGEAIRRIERREQPAACEIYLVDNEMRLLGSVELGRLLAADHGADLHKLMNHRVLSLAIHATAESLLAHPGWKRRRRLPVVERDNTLVGALDYLRLQDLVNTHKNRECATEGGLISLAELYWISMLQLLDSLFSMAGAGRKLQR